jgi:hypothetical protein
MQFWTVSARVPVRRRKKMVATRANQPKVARQQALLGLLLGKAMMAAKRGDRVAGARRNDVDRILGLLLGGGEEMATKVVIGALRCGSKLQGRGAGGPRA